MEERHYSRGDVIIRQSAPASDVSFIKHGMVEISRAATVTQEKHTLAYLRRGDLLGEVAALSNLEGLASATAAAITRVDLLTMKSAEFIELLETEGRVALALSRVLARRLKATTERVGTDDGMENRVSLVIGNGRGSGVTTVGLALAVSLASSTGNSTTYTEYPDSSRLSSLSSGHGSQSHLYGVAISTPANSDDGNVSPSLRTTLFAEQLTASYPNIVFGLTGDLDHSLDYLL